MSARSGQLPLFDARAAGPAIGVRLSARSRRLTVRVYPGGRVEVTAPTGTRPAAIEDFVARHRAWIGARLAEFASRRPPAAAVLPEAVGLTAVAEDWRVVYAARARSLWKVVAPQTVEIRGDATQLPAAQRALRCWLTAVARGVLEPRLATLAAQCGFRYGRLELRRQRTRWGSCARSGTISLNVCLLFQPAPVVRYLMLHELCHTRQMNHSARFWQLVASHEPEWRALDRELTRGWQRVPDWVYA